MFTIKSISPQETYAVRQPVLRPGKPVSSCVFDGDDLPTTLHFGIYSNDLLAGIISVFKANHELFSESEQYQIRGMAVLYAYQKQGLGEKLVRHAEDYIAKNGGKLIWFNAREVAVGFYERMGYTITGDAFNIADIGPHYVMFKILSES